MAMPPVASATVTSWPASAAVRAIASPTTPAPITRTCIALPPSCFPGYRKRLYNRRRKGRTMAGKRRSGLRAGRHCAGDGEGLRGRRQPARGLQYRRASSTSPMTNAPMLRRASPTACWKATSSNARASRRLRRGDRRGESAALPVALRTYKVVLQGDDVCVDLDRDAAGEPA